MSDSIFIIDKFINNDECLSFISRSENLGFEEAKLGFSSGARLFTMIRNNDRVAFYDEQLAQTLFDRAKRYLPKEIENCRVFGVNPNFRFYRYSAGQRFKMHKDGRQKLDNKTIESRLSFLIYLNDDFSGGETKFKHEDIKVSPEQGSALVFEHELWHEGVSLKSGQKYVLRTDVMYTYE